jgi:hypothetical protein
MQDYKKLRTILPQAGASKRSGVKDESFVNTSEKVKREMKSKFALIKICTRLQKIKADW